MSVFHHEILVHSIGHKPTDDPTRHVGELQGWNFSLNLFRLFKKFYHDFLISVAFYG